MRAIRYIRTLSIELIEWCTIYRELTPGNEKYKTRIFPINAADSLACFEQG